MLTDIPLIESIEGSRVIISNVFLDLSSPTFATNSTVRITNAFNLSQTMDLRVDARALEFQGKNKHTGAVNIRGLMSQFSTSDPRTNGYQILATSYWDELTFGPIIHSQPQSQTVVVGENATFSVTATYGLMTYQWFKNGVAIPNATGSSYTINEAVEADTGYYSVHVNNGNVTTPSRQAYLGVGNGAFSLLHYNVKGGFVSDFSTNSAQVQAIGRQLAHLQPDIVTLNEIPHGQTWQITNLVNHYLPGYFWATNSGTDGTIRSVILSRWRVSRSQKWLDGVNLAEFGSEGTFTRDLFEAEIDVPGFPAAFARVYDALEIGQRFVECHPSGRRSRCHFELFCKRFPHHQFRSSLHSYRRSQ